MGEPRIKRCSVPGCCGRRFTLGVCRRCYDKVRKRDRQGRPNPLKVYCVREKAEYGHQSDKWRARPVLVRCRCGELHVKDVGCGACRIRQRHVWFARVVLKRAL